MPTLAQLAHITRLSATLGLAVILGGCNQGNKVDANTAVAVATLAITGTPATSIAPGQAYAFQPTVVSTDSSTVSFSITNKPRWITLDTTNGHLSGQPVSADVGAYAYIEPRFSVGVIFLMEDDSASG